MREIKFRGKSLEHNKWFYGYLEEVVLCESNKFYIIQFSDWGLNIRFEVDEKSIGQYIGLKAKNEIRIYEGDIIEFMAAKKDFAEMEKCTITVKDITKDNFKIERITDRKVIGNIYENPKTINN